MSRQNRRNAVLIAVIAAVATIAAALITKQQSQVDRTAEQPKIENKADTKGVQSPAVAGAKDVTITYGEKPVKAKVRKPR